ncbi:hypothetical protein [Pseudomonas atagonensis]|uniref:hypothetical protein n=1 Tax=Pseudomonas atagonensis TaxID=2609964 RepID=UPI00140B6295|nr:hypothetical protein [Pseudomonas atagonensis]
MSIDASNVPPLNERLDFLSEIELNVAASARRVRAFSADGEKVVNDKAQGAFVMGDTFLNFMGGLSRGEKKAIKNSIRIAQIMSDRYVNEKLDLTAWLDLYIRTLNHVGWYTERKPGENRYSDFSGTVSRKMIEVVEALGNEPMLNNSLAAFSALEKHPLGLLSYAKATLYGKSFQTVPAGLDDAGRVKLVLNHARLESRRQEENFLFFQWRGGDVLFRHNYLSFYLDRAAYAETREKVESILEDDDMDEIDMRLELMDV